jgi:hypothetical protein
LSGSLMDTMRNVFKPGESTGNTLIH